jgi:hypothetical protein
MLDGVLKGVKVTGSFGCKPDGANVTGLSDVTSSDTGTKVGMERAKELGTLVVGTMIGLILGSPILGTTLGTRLGVSTGDAVGDKSGAVVEVDGAMFAGSMVEVATGIPVSFAPGITEGASVKGNELGFNVGVPSLDDCESVGVDVSSVLVAFFLHSLDTSPDESYTVIP